MYRYKIKFNFVFRTGFGLYEVNFNDTLRQRTPRESANYYANVTKTHSIDYLE